MKKCILILIVAFIHSAAFSQKIYFKGQAGYGIPFLKDYETLTTFDEYETYDSTTYSCSYETFKYSLGAGPDFSAGVGIMITKNLGFEVNGFYTSCKEVEMKSTFTVTSEIYPDQTGSYTHTYKGNCWGIKPSLLFVLPGKDFRPFARAGAILSFTSMKYTLNQHTYVQAQGWAPLNGAELVLEYEKNLSAGMNFSVGLEYQFLSRCWVFGEVEASVINYFPESASYTKYEVNGVDYLDQLSTSERELTFTDQYSDDENANPDEPSKSSTVRYSFSSIGFTVGLKYTLFD